MKIELSHDIIAAKVWQRLPNRQLREIRLSLNQRWMDYSSGHGSVLGKKELVAWEKFLDQLSKENNEHAVYIALSLKAVKEKEEKLRKQAERERELRLEAVESEKIADLARKEAEEARKEAENNLRKSKEAESVAKKNEKKAKNLSKAGYLGSFITLLIFSITGFLYLKNQESKEAISRYKAIILITSAKEQYEKDPIKGGLDSLFKALSIHPRPQEISDNLLSAAKISWQYDSLSSLGLYLKKYNEIGLDSLRKNVNLTYINRFNDHFEYGRSRNLMRQAQECGATLDTLVALCLSGAYDASWVHQFAEIDSFLQIAEEFGLALPSNIPTRIDSIFSFERRDSLRLARVTAQKLLSSVAKVNNLHIRDPRFVLVEGDSFMMGSDAMRSDTITMRIDMMGIDTSDKKWKYRYPLREYPRHKVSLSNFMIGKYETSIFEYVAFIRENDSDLEKIENWIGDFGQDKDSLYQILDNIDSEKAFRNFALGNVSWFGATAFSRWRADGKGMLPTEAQWEFAARGGKNGWKDSLEFSGSNDIREVRWSKNEPPIGIMQANQLGIFDMTGSMWEWCLDKYGSYQDILIQDPMGPSHGETCVLRGGASMSHHQDCRVAFRYHKEPDALFTNVGFRPAIPIKSQKSISTTTQPSQ